MAEVGESKTERLEKQKTRVRARKRENEKGTIREPKKKFHEKGLKVWTSWCLFQELGVQVAHLASRWILQARLSPERGGESSWNPWSSDSRA